MNVNLLYLRYKSRQEIWENRGTFYFVLWRPACIASYTNKDLSKFYVLYNPSKGPCLHMFLPRAKLTFIVGLELVLSSTCLINKMHKKFCNYRAWNSFTIPIEKINFNAIKKGRPKPIDLSSKYLKLYSSLRMWTTFSGSFTLWRPIKQPKSRVGAEGIISAETKPQALGVLEQYELIWY